MKKITMLMILVFASRIITAQDISFKQTVKGTIIDEQSGNVLQHASVTVEEISSSGDITDSLGNFKLKNVPIGRRTIRVSLMGYDDAVIRN
ncbi:MAG TPA: carboxypeptidase-like regulatory domain-containing protein, partial [Chitinophagaceae bacterium]|nr:carboxypeptidase-like regulatory domain-containing protein [Chitinophagaceae bacterium]